MSREHKFTSRTKARKRAVDVVFEADQRHMGRNPDVLRDLLRERKVLTAAQTPLPDYSVQAIAGVADHLRAIDRLIASHAKVAGLDRIAAVDLAVMRVATWEMLANADDVPRVIAIDEAVAIVKSLSTDASAGFVNGVLDAIRKEIESPAWTRERVGDIEPAAEWELDDADSDTSGLIVEYEDDVPDSEDALAVDPEPVENADTPAEDGRLGPDGKRYPTLADITAADLAELDELLDEY